MHNGLLEKFKNKELEKKLIDTKPKILTEGNTWNDKFWGVDLMSGDGNNILGILLMYVRSQLIIKQSLKHVKEISNTFHELSKLSNLNRTNI